MFESLAFGFEASALSFYCYYLLSEHLKICPFLFISIEMKRIKEIMKIKAREMLIILTFVENILNVYL